MHLTGTLLNICAVLASFADCLPTNSYQTGDSRVSVVYAFPNGTWVENIAVRSNGNLLVTLNNVPEVWEVDPVSKNATLIHHFEGTTSCLGIAEAEHDVFAVNTGNLTAGVGVTGTWTVQTLDFRTPHHGGRWGHHQQGNTSSLTAKLDKIIALPEANFLNGMSPLSSQPGTVMVGDSFLGEIFAVNTLNGSYYLAIDNPLFKPNQSNAVVLGINGLRVHDSELYFTNSFKDPLLAKIPISSAGYATGPAEVIVEKPQYPVDISYQSDDFAVDAAGEYVWLATDPSDVLVRITLATGAQEVVAGGLHDPTIAGATSVIFGRASTDKKILYIVTNGGLADPSAAGQKGGQVLAFDTTGL